MHVGHYSKLKELGNNALSWPITKLLWWLQTILWLLILEEDVRLPWFAVMWDMTHVSMHICSLGGAIDRVCIATWMSFDVYDICTEAMYAWCGLFPRIMGWQFRASDCCQFPMVG